MYLILLTIITALCAYLYKKISESHNFWEERNVVGPKPIFLFGNILENVLKKKSVGRILVKIYEKYQRHPVVGVYIGLYPQLLIRDPELVKTITVKEFRSFQNNDFEVNKKIDPVIGRNPFFLNDSEWKTTRLQLSPFFTNSKLKNLMPLLDTNRKRLIDYIKSNNASSLESKRLSTKFTSDNVAACAFGLDGKAFESEDGEFNRLANSFLDQFSTANLKFFLIGLIPIPFLARFFDSKLLSKETEDTIQNIVTETIKYREKNHVGRPDFINFLRSLKQQNAVEDVDLAGHAGTFMLDGIETTGHVISCVLYNLACNPTEQQNLREEIRVVKERNNGEIPFDAVKDMKYLDACMNESLRISSPISVLTKICTQDYEYSTINTEDFNPTTIHIEKGTSVVLPLAGFASDPKYFPKPKLFKPGRFLDDANKPELFKYVFFPFGVGPRTCLGQNFGILQTKLAVISVLDNFVITPDHKKTKLPLRYEAWNFLHVAKDGLWLDFKEIQ